MTRGFVKLPRAFFSFPLWIGEPNRRTQIEAYFDLLQRQPSHNTSVPLPTGHVDLHSGQLFISCGKLSEEWRWQSRQVKDYLEYLRNLGMVGLEEMQAGYRITLYDPPTAPSKNTLVNSGSSELSSENSSEEKKEKKNSKNYDLSNLPDSPGMREYKALHADFPGVLESVEFIEFKEKKRIQQRRPLEYGPKKLRELILEFQEEIAKEEAESGESATSEDSESAAEALQESGEKE